jgi:site-specific recombinase XerD
MSSYRPAQHHEIKALFDARIQTVAPALRYYRVAAHRFLSYLQEEFPRVRTLSDLHRDPHILGWIRCLGTEEPPLSNTTRRIYLVGLRRLLSASEADVIQTGLILPEDFRSSPPRPRKPRPPRCPPPLPHPFFGEMLDAHLQALAATRHPDTVQDYRRVARNFLSYLQTHFPQLRQLFELQHDTHWTGWLRSLDEQQPPLAEITRKGYRVTLRNLFRQLAFSGHLLRSELLVLPVRSSPQRRTYGQHAPLPHPTLGKIFETQIQTLATTLRPSTINSYRHTARSFLSLLQTQFPQLHQLTELRRDPHCLAWLRSLCEQEPLLSNATRQGYVFQLRRLLSDLAFQGQTIATALIVTEDLPPRPLYLPRALSSKDDRRLQDELRRTDDLFSNALLLTRTTGIRIGECIDLGMDCMRMVGQDQWALQVPLGKLYTERFVPIDTDIRNIIGRILVLRKVPTCSPLPNCYTLLLPRAYSCAALYGRLSQSLADAGERAQCSQHVTCHQLRHTYATEMVRLGVNLPTLMKLLGHKDIRMTLRYVQVTQEDLQREFFAAHHHAISPQLVPKLLLPNGNSSATLDVPSILQAISSTRHLLEMYRRQQRDEKKSMKLRRLANRLGSVATEFRCFEGG